MLLQHGLISQVAFCIFRSIMLHHHYSLREMEIIEYLFHLVGLQITGRDAGLAAHEHPHRQHQPREVFCFHAFSVLFLESQVSLPTSFR